MTCSHKSKCQSSGVVKEVVINDSKAINIPSLHDVIIQSSSKASHDKGCGSTILDCFELSSGTLYK